MANRINLKINGEPVRLNPFVQQALSGVIEGFIRSLDEIPPVPRRIEITIDRDTPQEVRT